MYKQCTSSLPLFQRNTNKQTIVCWNSFGQQCPSSVKWYMHIPFDWRRALLPETVSTYDRLLVSVTLEKREGACALFVQKTPDMFTVAEIRHLSEPCHNSPCLALFFLCLSSLSSITCHTQSHLAHATPVTFTVVPNRHKTQTHPSFLPFTSSPSCRL